MSNFGKLNFPVSFNPSSAFPLDARSYFKSYTEAEEAARSAKEVGSTEGVYYYGQELTVVENGEAKKYIIQPDNTLKEAVGSGGGVVIAEDEIIVVEGTFDGIEVIINEADIETVENYNSEKPMYLKLVSLIPTMPFTAYIGYTFGGLFSGVMNGAIVDVQVDTTTGKGTLKQEELFEKENILNEYTGITSSNTVFSSYAIRKMMGEPNGFASLNSNGTIPSNQLPSYVDDVIEGRLKVDDGTFEALRIGSLGLYDPVEGEKGKIYFDTNTGNIYRWSGSEYVRINPDEYTVATNADIDALFT